MRCKYNFVFPCLFLASEHFCVIITLFMVNICFVVGNAAFSNAKAFRQCIQLVLAFFFFYHLAFVRMFFSCFSAFSSGSTWYTCNTEAFSTLFALFREFYSLRAVVLNHFACIMFHLIQICVRKGNECVVCMLIRQCTWLKQQQNRTFGYRGCNVKNIYLVHHFQSSSQFSCLCTVVLSRTGNQDSGENFSFLSFEFLFFLFGFSSLVVTYHIRMCGAKKISLFVFGGINAK